MSVQTELQVLLGFILGSLAISVQHFGIRLHKAREYCEAEEFRASCNADEVVLMQSAKYGRMSLGRCVIRDYGYVGCEADVMSHMDSRCSGRRSCEIRIPDLTLDRVNPCPKDFKTYLEASYGCVKVPKPLCRACSNGTILQAETPGGYLGSITVEENNCGSASCPWILQALPGQKLNITLIDFALSSQRDANNGNNHFGIPEICYKYAVIKERGKKKDTTICGGKDRTKQMYLSDTNSVHIEVAGGRRGGNFGYFLLQYQVVGCPEFQAPSNMWLTKQEGHVTVGCTATGEKWKVKCDGNEWLGEVGECPYSGEVSMGSSRSKLPSIPFGILITVILAIAMIIGVLILTIGLVYIKRKRARDREEAARRATHQHYYNADNADKEKYSHYGKYHVPPHLANNINLYAARNMEMRPLPPVPKSPTPSEESGLYNTLPGQNEYNEPTQTGSGDGVFGVPSPHSGDFCTMPLPGRSGAYPQLRPQRKSSGDILEYPEENAPHYFELDPEGLPLPPPPEALLHSGVDVAPVHNSRVKSPGNNNTRKHMANGIGLAGLHVKTPEQENRENFGRETMTSRQDSAMSQQDNIPRIEYRGIGLADEHSESGKFSWP